MVRMRDLVRRAEPGPLPPAPPPAPSAARAGAPAPPSAEARPAPPPAPATPATCRPPEGRAEAALTPEHAEELFGELVRAVAEAGARVRADLGPPWADLEGVLARVVAALAESDTLLWAVSRPPRARDGDALARHQARVAVLAIRLASALGLDRARQEALGLAGCLLDVALWAEPPAARVEPREAEAQARYRAHPRASAELLRRWQPPVQALPDWVRHHHEREQGQGFPEGLAGAAVPLEAKVLGLADTYAALTEPPDGRPGLPPHEAVREIVRAGREAFPPALVKALLNELSVFPPGTRVRLNSGEVGRVVGVNRNHPLRPRVLVTETHGRAVPPKMVDLAEAPFLYITGPVAEPEGDA
jgi:hypothetical protein